MAKEKLIIRGWGKPTRKFVRRWIAAHKPVRVDLLKVRPYK